MPTPHRLHQVAVLALPGVLALDFGIPVHAFGNWDGGPYAVTVCTEIPGPVRVEGAPALLIEHGLELLSSIAQAALRQVLIRCSGQLFVHTL